MKVTQEGLAQRQAILTIEVEPQDLEQYLHRAYQRVVQRVSVPGFRKGKAPRSVLERLVGREALLDDAMDFLVPEMTEQAVKEQGLEPSILPRVEVLGTDPLVLKATVPLTPEVELADYRSLRMESAPVTVDEETVGRALEGLRREVTPWEPVERPIQMDDLVVMDLTGSVDGQQVINVKDTPYVVSENPFPASGFGAALVGMGQGEAREFDLPYPADDDAHQELAGKPCHFIVSATEVKGRHLPEMDDEFANGVGSGFDSLEALRDHVRTQIREAQEREARQAYEASVVERVLQDSQVELPSLLIEQEIEHLLEEMSQDSQSTGQQQADVDAYVASLGKSEEEIRAELQPRALERIQRAAVLAEVARREEVEVTQEELEEEIAHMVQAAGQHGTEMRRLLARPQNRESLTRSLRTRLTVQRMAEIARGDAGANAGEGQSTPETGATEGVAETSDEGPRTE